MTKLGIAIEGRMMREVIREDRGMVEEQETGETHGLAFNSASFTLPHLFLPYTQHPTPYTLPSTDEGEESLFERFHWLYAFCREHLFRDDTEQIAQSLWPDGEPQAQTRLLEIGCGPGFYSCHLAARYAQLHVTGIDRAAEQLSRARLRAAERQLDNCHFQKADVHALNWPRGSFDALVASRLFTILPEREHALAEMYRVLRSGGRCFIAEPRSMLRAALPLHAMWLLARLVGFCRESPGSYREPRRVAIMNGSKFRALVATQPWSKVRHWHDAWYQYAVCEKG